jgi:flavin-dependent dehydrogenase
MFCHITFRHECTSAQRLSPKWMCRVFQRRAHPSKRAVAVIKIIAAADRQSMQLKRSDWWLRYCVMRANARVYCESWVAADLARPSIISFTCVDRRSISLSRAGKSTVRGQQVVFANEPSSYRKKAHEGYQSAFCAKIAALFTSAADNNFFFRGAVMFGTLFGSNRRTWWVYLLQFSRGYY